MISTDRKIFEAGSPVAKRMIEYGEVFGELHIVIFSLEQQGFARTQLSKNVFAYPTNSYGKFFYIRDAVRIGKKIADTIYFGETALSTQDPFETGIVGFLLKHKTRLPLQVQIHTDFYSKQFYDGSLLNWLRFEISRFIIPRSDGIRVVREKIAQDLIKHFKIKKERITTLPIFLDIQKIRDYPITVNLKQKYPQLEKIILIASRLNREKRVDLALKAFAQIEKKFLRVGVVIVGSGPEKGKLETMVRSLGLTGRVFFEEWQQDIFSYYKTATVFLHTSEFEGFGMTLVEAAASGCPIISTNVGIAQDVLNDGTSALICPVGDKSCLANKLITFFENPLVERTLKQEAQKDIERLVIQKETYLSLYKNSLEVILQKQ